MDDVETHLLALVEDDTDRLPLLTLGEARAAVELLRILAAAGGDGAVVADHLAARLARRVPADEREPQA